MRFLYTAKDANGKTITQTDDAIDQEMLVSQLQKQGYFVMSVQPFSETVAKKAPAKSRQGNVITHNKVSLEDLLNLCQQFSALLDAGVPLLRSLDIISMQVESKQLYESMIEIRKSVEAGESLSASLAKHPKIFNRLWVSLVEVGEASGTMPTVLTKLAFYLEREAAFRSTIFSALMYPLVLTVVSFSAVLFFALVIGPKFKNLFESFGSELPQLTKTLLGTFDFIRIHFFLLTGIAGAIIVLMQQYVRTPIGRLQVERFFLSIPKFGDIYRTIIVERFTSQMSILTDSGVPILYALDITQRMVGNKVCENIITDIKNNVREGGLIAEYMNKSGFFPPMTIQMILVGEETGELGKMLKKVSEYYQEHVQTFLKRFSTLFEPIMLVVMAVVIGVIVIAMFLPIFNLSQLAH